MKKFFANLFVFLAMLLSGIAAVPWNDLGQWGLNFSYLGNNEVLLKGAIGALLFVFGLIFLLVANHENNVNNIVHPKTGSAAFLPLFIFSIAMMLYTTSLAFYIYAVNNSTTNLIILGALGLLTINLIVYGHFFSYNFRNESNGKRIMHFILLFELAALSGGIGYWLKAYQVPNYQNFNSYYFALIPVVAILLYIIHIIIIKTKMKNYAEQAELLDELNQSGNKAPVPSVAGQKQVSKKKNKEPLVPKDDKRTIIVSKEQTITSGEKDLDPTNLIYENVTVDPEFSKSRGTQPNSIEYYIEKPKMFKPLDPTFDELVAYVRELPHVITKIEDEKITFYIDRKPFLVLMNLGDYYRMAFKYDLEKGIRLIIKYPTISKNKSTRDELWFKANNYGDLPKEVIYQIVKTAYDNVNA